MRVAEGTIGIALAANRESNVPTEWGMGKRQGQSLRATRMEGIAFFKVRSQAKVGRWVCAQLSESLWARSWGQNGTVGQKSLQYLLDCVMMNDKWQPFINAKYQSGYMKMLFLGLNLDMENNRGSERCQETAMNRASIRKDCRCWGSLCCCKPGTKRYTTYLRLPKMSRL